jgi:hypothetical protein
LKDKNNKTLTKRARKKIRNQKNKDRIRKNNIKNCNLRAKDENKKQKT